MIIPVVPSLPAGTVVTAAEMNSIASACTFLLTRPMARSHDAVGGQSFGSTMANAVAVNFASKDFDTDGMWNSAQPTRLTVQTPGWYKVRYSVQASSTGFIGNSVVIGTAGPNNPIGSGQVIGKLLLGYCDAALTSSPPPAYVGCSGIYPVYLYQGDYLTVNVWSNVNTDKTGAAASYPFSSFCAALAST